MNQVQDLETPDSTPNPSLYKEPLTHELNIRLFQKYFACCCMDPYRLTLQECRVFHLLKADLAILYN